jgi:hypothetical protein
MGPVAANTLFINSILPQDYRRFAVVSWNDNLTGATESELYASIAYAQQTYNFVSGGWL